MNEVNHKNKIKHEANSENLNSKKSQVLCGRAFKFGDGISTDLIAPGRYFHLRSNLTELAKHLLEDAEPEFTKKVKKGDFIVAGKNFGLGSSREHAPAIIKIAGVGAVLAKSFARIFFRNSINVGLPALICDTDKINSGDELEVDLRKGIVKNITQNIELNFNPLPEVMIKILNDGGLVEHIIKNKGFNL
ncbi:MAG: 3-isopropylmalate dehydratase small subunit [Actinobacteria bacterium]|nr:3-isopropylmalate dehydratase small subunit [Actinomycetota bacterium]